MVVFTEAGGLKAVVHVERVYSQSCPYAVCLAHSVVPLTFAMTAARPWGTCEAWMRATIYSQVWQRPPCLAPSLDLLPIAITVARPRDIAARLILSALGQSFPFPLWIRLNVGTLLKPESIIVI